MNQPMVVEIIHQCRGQLITWTSGTGELRKYRRFGGRMVCVSADKHLPRWEALLWAEGMADTGRDEHQCEVK